MLKIGIRYELTMAQGSEGEKILAIQVPIRKIAVTKKQK